MDDVVSLSKIPDGGRILEIDCGPGNATILFARRGFEILAVELGSRLSGYAKQNCRVYPSVMVLNMAFEDWSVEARGFDLAISADAFHWIQPEFGYPKVACALRPAGKLACFWNTPSEMDPDIVKALAHVHRSRAPQAEMPEGRFTEAWMIRTITDVITQSGCYSGYSSRIHTFLL